MSGGGIRGNNEDLLRRLSPEQRRGLERLLAEKRAQIPRVPRDQPLPLSFAQSRLWFLEQLEGHTGAYNVPMAWRLRGALDAAALDRALADVVRRHELLRTCYPAGADGLPRAVIRPFAYAPTPLVDLSDAPDAADQLARRVAAERTRRFALASEPPLRWSIVRMGPDDHVLVLCLHHVAVDGWALGVLTRELWATYAAFARGEPSPLPELAIQYVDVAAHQRAQLGPARMEALAAHWAKAIEGAAQVVELWPDHPRPAVQSFRGRVHELTLDAVLVERVKALARESQATPFMVLLAAWAAMIARRSGQEDFLVGSPIAHRTTREAEQLVGCFINTLALRVRPALDHSFRALLAEVRATAVAAYEHQDFPFEQLVERFCPTRSLSHAPLFQTMLVVQNAPPPQFEVPGLALEHLRRPDGVAMFDLTLTLTEEGARGMRGELEYASDLFTPATAARLAEHFAVLLRGVVERPDAPVGALPLLAADERHQVVEAWNATERPLDARPPVARFLAQAAATPAAAAVSDAAVALDYRALEARSRGWAAALAAAGVRRGDRVGVHLERSADVVAALLGVWRAGAAYVPLDPAFPAARLAYQCESAGVRVVITATDAERALPAELARVLAPVDGPLEEVTPRLDERAYVLFTSGSTGRPKGVAVSHGALGNLLSSMADAPGLSARDRLLAVTTISFDIAGLELFGPLMVGAGVVVASRGEAHDARALLRAVERAEPTVLQATPATWRALFEAGWRGRAGLRVWVGGEALTAELCDRLLAAGDEVWNLYGPTETTIWSTAARLQAPRAPGSPTIGGPIANTRVYVVDARTQPVPVGVPGRLMIGGAGVAEGYWGQEELTRARFSASPFVAGDRLYDTGDRARWRADGTLEFLGRDDLQVKVRGFRIELGEIESDLSGHPAVARAVAHVRGEGALVAYVVPAPGAAWSPDALKKHLRLTLPEYMIPAVFVPLGELPLTANGKVDRSRLPAPELRPPTAEAARPPRDGLERALLELWREVLEVPGTSVEDNFFDLGGHSLLAVRLLDRVERALGRKVTLMDLFRAPTVVALAELLRGAVDRPTSACLEPLRPEGARPPLFFVGSTAYARRLLPHLGDDQPVYGLNLFGLFEEARAPEVLPIDEIAAEYVRQIGLAQPRGPYQLLAYCADAVVAYAVAQQLVAAGERVTFVGFIDFVWERRPVGIRSAEVLAHNLRDFGPQLLAVKARRRGQYYLRELHRLSERVRARARRTVGTPVPRAERHAEVVAAYYRGVSTYPARPLDLRIDVFVSQEERMTDAGRLRELARGGVVLHEVPGYHDAMFEAPGVDALGRLVRAALDRDVSR